MPKNYEISTVGYLHVKLNYHNFYFMELLFIIFNINLISINHK